MLSRKEEDAMFRVYVAGVRGQRRCQVEPRGRCDECFGQQRSRGVREEGKVAGESGNNDALS